jgi:AMP nucleosidase
VRSGEELKKRLRTGTVLTYDDRNWELRWAQERPLINLSRAVAVDMESGTIAAQGYRLRVPYGTSVVRLGQTAAQRNQAAGLGERVL